jgi:hypothetical protein
MMAMFIDQPLVSGALNRIHDSFADFQGDRKTPA